MTTQQWLKPFKSWVYVLAQFVLIAACLWGIHADLTHSHELLHMAVSSGLFIGGVFLGLWALWSMGSTTFSVLPSPVPDGSLCERGPYQWVCHPMYTAVLLVCLAAWVLNPTWLRSFAWVLLLLVLIGKLRFEETLLAQRFSGYRHYQKNRHRLLPFLF